MSNIFRRSYTLPIPPDAVLIDAKGIPSAKFKKGGKTKTAPLTIDGTRISVQSPTWYGWIDGKAVKLFTDAVASQQRLAELLRKSELQESGILDPYEQHRPRPLVDHLADWAANLKNRGKTTSHINATTACVRRILEACKFTRMSDISASAIEQYLADLRTDGPALDPLDPVKAVYTKREVAACLGINKSAVGSLVKRHRLAATGNGKSRRYPRETVEALRQKRSGGIGIKTSNLYLSGMKAFCAFLVRDKRLATSPLIHLRGQDAQRDRRLDRRFLDDGELARLIEAALNSGIVFRDLTGPDRAMLYRVACTSGLRASELAALTPRDFDLDKPLVTLSGAFSKNRKDVEQPLPVEVAELLRPYLAGRPGSKVIWPGTWHMRAADMLRIDLEAAGIPFEDGGQVVDFHALRHSFIAMLDRSGATLKEAMQLARHSDPKLTMKVYGRARRHDLAGAVNRLPSLKVKEPAPAKRKAR